MDAMGSSQQIHPKRVENSIIFHLLCCGAQLAHHRTSMYGSLLAFPRLESENILELSTGAHSDFTDNSILHFSGEKSRV